LRKSKSENDKIQCNVINCTKLSKRSLSFKRVEEALPKIKFEKVRKKVHLCKEHYKEYKKATKEKRKIETLTWD